MRCGRFFNLYTISPWPYKTLWGNAVLAYRHVHVGLNSNKQYWAQYIIHLKSMQLRHNAMLAMCMYDQMLSKGDYVYLSVRLSVKSTIELTVDLTTDTRLSHAENRQYKLMFIRFLGLDCIGDKC